MPKMYISSTEIESLLGENLLFNAVVNLRYEWIHLLLSQELHKKILDETMLCLTALSSISSLQASNLTIPWVQSPKQEDIFDLLIKHGATFDLVKERCGDSLKDIILSRTTSLALLKALAKKGMNLAEVSTDGDTLLRLAVQKMDFTDKTPEGDKKHIDFALQVKGLSPEVCYQSTGTTLHSTIANELFSPSERYYKAKYLIDQLIHFHPAYNWNVQDGQGKTVLLIAAKMRATELVEKLLQCRRDDNLNMDVNLADEDGRTPLHYACAYGDYKSVQALLAAESNIRAPDKEGRQPKDYLALSRERTNDMLKSIFVDPQRDEHALRNCFELSPELEKVIDAKQKIPSTQANIGRMRSKLSPHNPSLLSELSTIQYRNFSGISLGEACLQGRAKVEEYLVKHEKAAEKEDKKSIAPDSREDFKITHYTNPFPPTYVKK